MTDETWQLRGADDRLTIVRRPQGCVDLALDDTTVAYVTGRGRPLNEILSVAGVAYRCPNGRSPIYPPTPSTAGDALAELVAAIEAAGVVTPGPEPKPWTGPRSDVEVPGRIAPPQTRGIVADLAGDATATAAAVTALLVAYEKARAVLGNRTTITSMSTPTTT
jgi:hypothetical protein